MKRTAIGLTLCLSVLLSLGSTSQSATVVKLSLDDMVSLSTNIVHGKVIDVTATWNEEKTQIFTTVTVKTTENLKGNKPPTFTFKQLGGTVGDRRVSVPGFPVYEVGSETVLFLTNDPYDRIATVGLGQGKFKVYTDEKSGEKMVANDVLGLELLDSSKLTEASTMRMNLSELKKSIKQAQITPKSNN